jgi:hypothetical protein
MKKKKRKVDRVLFGCGAWLKIISGTWILWMAIIFGSAVAFALVGGG